MGDRPNLLHPFQPGSLGGWRNNTLVLQHKPSSWDPLPTWGACSRKAGRWGRGGKSRQVASPLGDPCSAGRAPSLNSVTSRRQTRPGLGARRPPKARSLARQGLRMPVQKQQKQPAGRPRNTARRQEGVRSGSRAGRGSRGSRGGRGGSPGGAG